MAKIAILGHGVVGGGTAEVIAKNFEKVARSAGEPVEIKYILEAREMPDSPFKDKFVKDFSVIENDPEVSVVAECLGGLDIPYDFARRSLAAGKSFVTCNKHLIAERGLELLTLAKLKGVSLLFEASVGGGIPILRPLTQCLSGNEIVCVRGILNGTTNYILNQMQKCSAELNDALKEAQRLGYAEADPTADVEGIDTCRKICILADLSFGKNVTPDAVRTKGIMQVSKADMEAAQALGYAIKLLGTAEKTENGVYVEVAPEAVSCNKLLSGISGVMNGVEVTGNAVGETLFYGAGAGRYPTASAMVADIINAVLHKNDRKYVDWAPGGNELLMDPDDRISRWLVRSGDDTVVTDAMNGRDVAKAYPAADACYRIVE